MIALSVRSRASLALAAFAVAVTVTAFARLAGDRLRPPTAWTWKLQGLRAVEGWIVRRGGVGQAIGGGSGEARFHRYES